MKSGEFQLQPDMSVRHAIQLFESGKTVLYELRFIEGWTFAEAMSALRQDPQIRHTLDPNVDDAQIMQRLGRTGSAAEGRLFPDTYRFPRGTTDIAFLKRAADTMDRVLAEEWDGRAPNLPYEDATQALVMASIVEKETADAGERSRIAGVFVRRLQQGMRLQTDPTVIYGLGSRFDGNLRLRDLRADTPFNTYTRAGLPPTPICLPSRASIHAAMHPDDGKALFFVSRGDGTHEFSETLRQHEAAVRRYQLGKR